MCPTWGIEYFSRCDSDVLLKHPSNTIMCAATSLYYLNATTLTPDFRVSDNFTVLRNKNEILFQNTTLSRSISYNFIKK